MMYRTTSAPTGDDMSEHGDWRTDLDRIWPDLKTLARTATPASRP